MELTPKEQQLFDFIESYQLKHGASPTVKEMRMHMKLKSDGFVVHCIKSLVDKEVIQKGDTPRSIKLLPRVAEQLHSPSVRIPILGTIPAGGAVVTEESVQDWVSIDESQIRDPRDAFVLKVRGDSMIDAGIFEGDHVIADSKRHPKVNDIVIALVDGGSTVKRYMMKNGKAYLKAENKEYSDIHPEQELYIQGVVVGLMRWY
ncbi:repressor LexA [Candidatus Gracilibacteria bacterium]|nr:repressor LexA [Candidatus Gracilibacteria bacterium]